MADLNILLGEDVVKKTPAKVFSKTTLSNGIAGKLFEYQEKSVLEMINSILKYNVSLNNGDTGVGKTYCVAAACIELKRRPIIICPKIVLYNWENVLDYFGIEPYDIVNYETIRTGKTYLNSKYSKRKNASYIEIVEPDEEDPIKSIFKWNLPEDAILIFDEAHRCKEPSTDNGKLLISSKQAINNKIPVILLSATICETRADMKIPFYLFNLIPNTRNFNHYIKLLKLEYPHLVPKRRDFDDKNEYLKAKDNSITLAMHQKIKPYVSRIKISELGDKFPSNQWCAQLFVSDDADKIAELYEELGEHMDALKEEPGSHHLAAITKLEQQIEMKKAPIIIDQAESFLSENKSVIIFVNYTKTLEFISDKLNIKCKIHGKQTILERNISINLFQSNKERIIICQSRAGGIGVSLHDVHGGHPRAAVMNFPKSGSDLIQMLGRAARAGALSPVIQRIVCIAGVPREKKVYLNMNKKLSNISAINDGDLDVYSYKVKKGTIKKKIDN